MPVLVLAGDKDQVLPSAEEAVRLVGEIPVCKKVCLYVCMHVVCMCARVRSFTKRRGGCLFGGGDTCV